MLFRILMLLLFSVACASCNNSSQVVQGSGKVVKEDRKVEPFRKIVVGGSGNLFLKEGEKPALVVETDDNLMEYLRSQVSEGVLYIETLNNVSLSPTKDLDYYVTVNNLSGLEISGAAKVKSLDQIKSDDLKLVLSGAGTIVMDVDTPTLVVHLSGSGNLVLSGKAEKQIIDVSGAGTYRGFELVSNTAQVGVSGVGNAEINASDNLEVDVSGVGSVNYKGTPKLRQSISGVGTIRHVD